MGKLGAEVVASDLQPNLALLKDNMSSNGGRRPLFNWKFRV